MCLGAIYWMLETKTSLPELDELWLPRSVECHMSTKIAFVAEETAQPALDVITTPTNRYTKIKQSLDRENKNQQLDRSSEPQTKVSRSAIILNFISFKTEVTGKPCLFNSSAPNLINYSNFKMMALLDILVSDFANCSTF